MQPQTDYYQQSLVIWVPVLSDPKEQTTKHMKKAVSVKTSNISLGTGSDILFTNGATVDTSPILPKGAERRIAIIRAAKDMTIQGNLTLPIQTKQKTVLWF